MMGEECSLPQDVSTAEHRTNREHDVSPHPFTTLVRDALEVAYDHVRESLHRTAARRKRLYDTKAVIMGVMLLPSSRTAQVGLSLDWTSSSRSSGHRSYIWYTKGPRETHRVCSCG